MSVVPSKKLERNLRLDASYYLPKFVENERTLDSMGAVEIGDRRVSKLVTDGDHGYPIYSDEGIYYIKSKELRPLGIDYSVAQKVPYEYAEKLGNRCKLNQEDVIVSTVGTIGTVFIVKEEIPPSVLSRDIAKIVTNKENILPEYLYLFLNSRFGQLQIERESGGSIQTGLYLYAINKIKIPLIDMDKQYELAKRVAGIVELKLKSKELLGNARNLLFQNIF
jgi:restriction endonuclease S subunit